MASTARLPTVSPAFMKSYDHAHPSGNGHPACKRNRLANIGIDCRRNASSPVDLDLVTDRTYAYLYETSDDGWLIGGGEDSKLKRPDTAHAEIWRFGPDNEEHGGIPFATVDAIMRQIAFAPMRLKPLRVNFTATSELELLCAYEPQSAIGQLFGLLSDVLACPCGDYGNPFHITMARGVKFRSEDAKQAYFAKMKPIVARWNAQFPDGLMFNDGGVDLFENRETILFHYPPRLKSGIEADLEQLRALRQ
jgi:hypothetical protein